MSDSNNKRTTKQEMWAALGVTYNPPAVVTHIGDGQTPVAALPTMQSGVIGCRSRDEADAAAAKAISVQASDV